MRSSIKLQLTALSAFAMLAGCTPPSAYFFNSPPSEIYYKDGRVAYVASCKAANWGPCLEKAGQVCKNLGYTVLEKTSSRSYGDDEKELVFACTARPEAGETKPVSGSVKSGSAA